ncbi:MAG: Clp protease ClpP [Tannerella sp.]|jgi:ATP-dependent protease ClpP protease subunit|nr:Clp protease ClpP [Tannerella sp.]
MAKIQLGQISIVNQSADKVMIDIEGIIGIPEWWQFDDSKNKISTWDKFKSRVDEIKNLKAKNVTVNIRSIGGNTNHALMIHDALSLLEAEVTTVCFGYTASAATIIAQSAGDGRRHISSSSLYLIHQCSIVASGNIAEVKNAIVTMEKTNETIAKVYAGRSGEPVDSFVAIMDKNGGRGEWMTADEALQAKLVDRILHVAATSNLDTDNMELFNYPDIPSGKLISKPEPEDGQDGQAGLVNAIVAGIKDFFHPINKITPTMNKTYVTVNTLLNVEGIEMKDGKAEMTEEQLKTLNDAIDAANAAKKAAEDKVTEKETEIGSLKEQIAAAAKAPGAETPPVVKPTETPVAEDGDGIDIKSLRDLYRNLPD